MLFVGFCIVWIGNTSSLYQARSVAIMSLNIPVLNEDILSNVFILLPIKDLVSCRSVSKTWRMIVNNILDNDDLWHFRGKEYFNEDLYLDSRRHRIPGLSWRGLYESLSLWGNLRQAVEVVQQLPFSSSPYNEITNFQLLRNGSVGILSRSRINHVNILNHLIGKLIIGEYRMYAENNNHIIVLNYQKHLIIRRKAVYIPEMSTYPNMSYSEIQSFSLFDPVVVLITTDNKLCYVSLTDNELDNVYVDEFCDPILCVGHDRNLYVLTYGRKIYCLIGGCFQIIYVITKEDDLLNVLLRYNLTPNMDWLAYQQWLYIFHNDEPSSLLQDITTVKKYGDIILVGTKWSDLFIYHVPKAQQEVSLYKMKPIKSYNLSDYKDVPKYSKSCPIVQVDVMEGKGEHIIVVATPNTVSTITLRHGPPANDYERIIREDSQVILSPKW